tara:strand:+ start:2776 stop:3000 length:225 start_codon:yes stop_codon:yes gene_type:complete
MSADTTFKMQSIIDKHMLAAFEEMESALGDTPNDVTVYVMQAYDENGIDSTCEYQGCAVVLIDEYACGKSRCGL